MTWVILFTESGYYKATTAHRDEILMLMQSHTIAEPIIREHVHGIMTSLADKDAGEASGVSNTFRELGGVFGVVPKQKKQLLRWSLHR